MESNFYLDVLVPILSNDIIYAINFLKNKHVLRSIVFCNSCQRQLAWRNKTSLSDKYAWKCTNKECGKHNVYISIRQHSFLFNSRLTLKEAIHLIYLWSLETKIKIAAQQSGTSEVTVINFFKKLRGYCHSYLICNPIRLGGVGRTVQIDESLFCFKTKYHRGRRSETEKWIFGLVDVDVRPIQSYMEVVAQRNAETLLPIIERVVVPGSTIQSDEWAAYNQIETRGYIHKTVNHSKNFVNPNDGTHTQNIESFWNTMKLKIKTKKGIQKSCLSEYIHEWNFRNTFKYGVLDKILECLSIYHDL